MSELSERLQGILDGAVVAATLRLTQYTGQRPPPQMMDELRTDLELAVRAAALEGARASGVDLASALADAKIAKSYLEHRATIRR